MEAEFLPPPPHLLERFCLEFLLADSFSSDCYSLIPDSHSHVRTSLNSHPYCFCVWSLLCVGLERVAAGRNAQDKHNHVFPFG